MTTWRCEPWSHLTTDELYRILALRQEVFVVEQACPYQDLDGRDRSAYHLWTDASDGARVLAYARLFGPGVRYAEACIGRVVTASEVRRSGLGRALMAEAIARLTTDHGPVAIRIGAQRYLEQFYRDAGFATVSPEYLEDGIPHVEMVRSA
ncbi:MAG: GNAT family N-acetyltransferase [Myxococcales bacterium]|nr:GNAT family N-acetyltransferase [Myxococcales bacterium]